MGEPPRRAGEKGKHKNMAKRSKYQQRVIRDYYKNRDEIALQKLGEYATDLYLAEGKARVKKWQHVADALRRLEVPESRIEHLLAKDDPALLASLVKELWSKP